MSQEKNNPKILVCVNRRFGLDTPSCAMRNSDKILKALKGELLSRGHCIKLEEVMCLGQCVKGPALRLAPGGDFYLKARLEQIDEIADWVESRLKASSK